MAMRASSSSIRGTHSSPPRTVSTDQDAYNYVEKKNSPSTIIIFLIVVDRHDDKSRFVVGALENVSVAVKDNIDVAGFKTGCKLTGKEYSTFRLYARTSDIES